MGDLMHAVGYRKALPISDPDSLVDADVPVPTPGPHDLLVRVEAVSVNPADVKSRSGSDPDGFRILGYDAAGVVTAVGAAVTRFGVGDEVWYAGRIDRPGSNARFQTVNENIVGPKPASLDFAAAAALPLTTITAWEMLFDHFGLTEASTGTLLMVGAAGGVGSMVLQLARARTGLTVVGTAGRGDSQQWAGDMGAHHVVDRHHLVDSVRAVAPDGVDYIISPFSKGNIEAYAELIRPLGHIAATDEPAGLDLLPLKPKSVTWHWELMFTRPILLPDDAYQSDLLTQTAKLVDAGTVRSTMTTRLGPLDAATMRDAHARVEASAAIGKVVVTAG
ncbi:zinc-binding alcohol dehydrogenase family protein [Asanoa sp. WMMD1127]|uniref:zinc-binding alcohol dehydrogenase family protein n=1 Tax=Asanoa sp. WMMD1127 TaxID=3016107 RepID=UPI002416A7EC|nr:zinc-binding alcohol dehydrogenase family protein [Asanoa sp. WMMD1127]MDG4824101.1 zinc-binding alcohol dehydrogenase family protein [Asanoa sp. WMMD1127]